MDELIKSCLFPILNTEVDDEIVQYIKQMKIVEDFEEFIDNVMDKSNKEHVQNYEKLKNNLFNKGKSSNSNKNTSSKPVVTKREPTEAFPSLPASSSNKKSNNLGSKDVSNKFGSRDISNKSITPPANKGNQKASGNTSGKGKKTKYVNVGSLDTSLELKKGRHPCDCEAKTHLLINNCLKCGRIVCEQEGSGPCFFCDNMVCTNEEYNILESNSKQSDKLYNQLKTQQTSKEWKKAIEVRDRLLKADRSGDYKKTVYDDQGDYYEGNKWKSGDTKNVPRIHKSRADLKLALDFASRTLVIENDDDFESHKGEIMKGVDKLLNTTDERFPRNSYDNYSVPSIVSPNKFNSSENNDQVTELSKIKVANNSFLAEIDRGQCLSMHQPWASLLVSGIKLHEGRTWYTEHRGRLWIHAGSKEPLSSEILEVENVYKAIYNDPELEFPREYPRSCLIGCVFVEDCLKQDKYRQLFPNGESDSPYVLICTNPIILPVFFPMQGQFKIFSLSKDTHRKAKEGIMAAKWL